MLDIDTLLELSKKTLKNIYVPENKFLKPGGDGTDGVMNNDVLNRLKCAREIIMHKDIDASNQDSMFHIGDIVYCENCKEHGIVLGEKPSGNLDRLVDECSKIKLGTRKKDPRTYVILTINITDTDLLGGPVYDFRIRYVHSRYMNMYDKYEPLNTTNDLENFCNKQCIMECSEDCYLYKYFKSKQIK